MSLAGKLVEWNVDKVEEYGRDSNMGRLLRANGVPTSPDFRRILNLPRRRWEDADDLDLLVELLTQHLRPEGYVEPDESERMALWRVQAAALRDAHDWQGLFAPIGVGKGKTPLSLLLPVVMKAERPALVVPSKLVAKTHRAYAQLGRHFRMHPRLRILSYHDLSSAKNRRLLWEIKPDLLVFDEGHKVRYKSSTRTRRVVDYLKEHPTTRVCVMSGTITKRSIMDFQHLLVWSLKPDLCPLPIYRKTLMDWADAVDVLRDNDKRVRMAPGVLSEFCKEGESVRQAVARRINETPGVVASLAGENECDASLLVSRWDHRPSDATYVHLDRLRKLWETPNGDLCTQATEVWRHAREIALGFCYRWDPAAPKPWLEARRAWKTYVRERLKRRRSSSKADSELLIFNECKRMEETPGETPPKEWRDWVAIRNTFKPNTVAEWFSDDVVHAAAEWLHTEPVKHPGVVWVEPVEFAIKLASVARVPYFGAGRDDIERYAEPCVASIRSHAEGLNLQHKYHRGLVLSPSAAGDDWEQLLGRFHRVGQPADEVTYEVYLPCDDLRESFRRALGDSIYIEEMERVPKKLNHCDVTALDD